MPRAGEVHILVVDDDEGMVVTLRDVLGSVGYVVETASSGPEALERVRGRRPDCILMDIRMPGMTGIDAYREIKRLSPNSYTIFMTAYTRSSLVEEAQQEGAIAVLTKPLDLEQVLHLVEATAGMTPVLIVNDDAAFCHTLDEALTSRAFDVEIAQTLHEAIALFKRQPCRIVILDRKVEGDSGFDVVKLMREIDPRAIVLPLTAFSALEEGWHDEESLPQASVYLEKPFEIEDLIDRIQQAVEGAPAPLKS